MDDEVVHEGSSLSWEKVGDVLMLRCDVCVCVFCAAAIPVGIVVVRGDCDLETCRLYIDRLQEASPCLFIVNITVTFSPSSVCLLAIVLSGMPAAPHPECYLQTAGPLGRQSPSSPSPRVFQCVIWLCANPKTCLLCLLGLTPGAICWPQSALPGI